MQATFLAVRAIGAEFARGLWLSAFIGALVIATPLVALLSWLTSQNPWWWLLDIPVGIILIVTAVLLVAFHIFIRSVRPAQTPQQKEHVKAFAQKLQFASEISSTPKLFVLFRVIRSIARPTSETYLQNLLETASLQKDFVRIIQLFRS